jgi:hypothetical protein
MKPAHACTAFVELNVDVMDGDFDCPKQANWRKSRGI